MRSPYKKTTSEYEHSKMFKKIERWTMLAGLKRHLKNSASLLFAQNRWYKKVFGVLTYSLLAAITAVQVVTVSILALSMMSNVLNTTPMFATLLNSELGIVEKIKTIARIGEEESLTAQGGPEDSCTDLQQSWNPDLNTYIDGQVLHLKPDKLAGSAVLKEAISSFFGLELVFKTDMVSGVNTVVAVKNSDGTLKYAIGDGDFKTIRVTHTNSSGVVLQTQQIRLEKPINSTYGIGFKLNTIEKASETLAIGALTYRDQYGDPVNVDLDDVVISNPQGLYIDILVGLDARQEIDEGHGLEIVSCSVTQMEPSKLLNF